MTRVVHELRAPLDQIIAISAKVSLDPKLDPAAAAQVSRIRRFGERQRQVLNELLELDALLREQLPLTPTTTVLSRELQTTLDMVQQRADWRELSLRLQLIEPVPVAVRIDCLRLRQVLLKLLMCVIESADEGEVRLCVESTAGVRSSIVNLRFTVESRVNAAPADGSLLRADNRLRRNVQESSSSHVDLSLEVCDHLLRLLGSRLDILPGRVRSKAYSFILQVPLAAGKKADLQGVGAG